MDLDAIETSFRNNADKDWEGGLQTRFAVNGLVVLGEHLVSRVRELEEALARLFSRTGTGMDWTNGEGLEIITRANNALIGKSIPPLNRLDDLENDNAALRLAATELYEFVTHDCGIESQGMDAIYRMANVLGVVKEVKF
jgi:hypothetical protein